MTMETRHYSEADLLETYYTAPGDSMPVMMHLAGCAECAARYERLERKIRNLAACEHDRPETFWARQRLSIMRTIERKSDRRSVMPATARLAAAAVVVVAILTGVIVTRDENGIPAPTDTVATTVTASASPITPALEPVPANPWQSEELSDFQSVVAWESWVDEGDQSL
jgi:predicted anti-sigma-YlaC factor YlaD